jgi:hypothetical protein
VSRRRWLVSGLGDISGKKCEAAALEADRWSRLIQWHL